jgi:hypothetical protein
VARTDRDSLFGVEVALRERPVVVRAAILDRAEPASEVVDADRELARPDDLDRARRELVEGTDGDRCYL